ncbi:heparin lyase I family protein [Catalinimonas niigatensis]|uniref:heparin lyase I family protein n=1 Tax=Catalinimonas niigatensis TaxID=1397264 RepID=UPI002665DDE6|nr:heparin lyase I family protein [Catalinimonas niigatensis]WPP50289.1 heparin lyase I family protein [Catalinimonas niigatensis]
MKHFSITCLLFLLIGLTNCAEDDILSSDFSDVNLSSESVEILNPRQPVLTRVTTDGTKVTLEFTNHASPNKPEGGYELMVNGKRTGNTYTPRLDSNEKNLTMVFNIGDAASKNYQVYARWNSGYLSSNALDANESLSGESTSSSSSRTSTGTSDVKAPSNLKQPVISDVSIDGSDVVITFVNFSAPQKPEGGYELMVNGERTKENIVPRLNSSEKVLTMKFRISNPQSKYYQIYARWNSGYIRSEIFRPGSSSPSSPSESPTPDDDESDDDNGSGDDSGSDDNDGPSTLSNMKLIKTYDFENGSQGGLQTHKLGRQDGQIVSVDGVKAYRFRITPTGPKNSYRQELIPRDLPYPYFDASNGFEANWNKEYVYEVRMKFSSNHQTGSDWTSFFGAKNDYTVSRQGAFTMRIWGDHYWSKQHYARNFTTNRNGEGSVDTHFAANGEKIRSGSDFNNRGFGSGYTKYDTDKNRWVKWTYHIKWSYNNSGFIRVYKNGDLFYSYNGPTGCKDDQAPYIKFGLYNASWKNGDFSGSKLQEAYVDYLKVYVPNNW